MSSYFVRVELAGERRDQPLEEASVERVLGHLVDLDATAQPDGDRTVLMLTLGTDSAAEPAALTAVDAVAAACQRAEVGGRVCGVRVLPEGAAEAPRTWAVHVELDQAQVSDEQIDQLTDLLAEHGAAVGINDYGWLTMQFDVVADDFDDAGWRARGEALRAGARVGLGRAKVIQLEVLADPEELERRSAIPPAPWLPRLLTAPQVADRLGMTISSVDAWAADGLLGAIRPGQDYLFFETVIDQERRRRARGARGPRRKKES